MPTYQNTGFEDPGPNPGDADFWIWTIISSVEEWGDFDTLLDPEPFEDFNEGWNGNESFLPSFFSEDVWQDVVVCTTVDIVLSGEQVIDGILTDQTRVLVWNQVDETENGIYTSDPGPWVRTDDADESGEFVRGKQVYCALGATGAGNLYYYNGVPTPELGVDDIEFVLLLITAIYNLTEDLVENFEREWAGGNQVHFDELPPSVFALYNIALNTFDSFETEWSNNQDDITEFAPADLTAAEYGPFLETFESFESNWSNNQDDKTGFIPADLDFALYNKFLVNQEPFESFEEVGTLPPHQTVVRIVDAGNPDDDFIVLINGVPVSYEYTGVGGEESVRNNLIINSVNVNQDAQFIADPGDVEVLLLRNKTAGQLLEVFTELETTGIGVMQFGPPPDPEEIWTALGFLEY